MYIQLRFRDKLKPSDILLGGKQAGFSLHALHVYHCRQFNNTHHFLKVTAEDLPAHLGEGVAVGFIQTSIQTRNIKSLFIKCVLHP